MIVVMSFFKKTTILQYPKYLLLNLKRIVFQSSNEIQVSIHIPSVLKLPKVTANKSSTSGIGKDARFVLRGGVNYHSHSKKGVSGHYDVTQTMKNGSLFVQISDSRIKLIPHDEYKSIMSTKCYIALYEMSEWNSTCEHNNVLHKDVEYEFPVVSEEVKNALKMLVP